FPVSTFQVACAGPLSVLTEIVPHRLRNASRRLACLPQRAHTSPLLAAIWRDLPTFTRVNCTRASNRTQPTQCENAIEGQIMTTLEAIKSKNSSGIARVGRLFVLELSGDRIHSMNPDGSDRKTIVTDCRYPDGIAVDVQAGHIYWTNMGIPNLNDGS